MHLHLFFRSAAASKRRLLLRACAWVLVLASVLSLCDAARAASPPACPPAAREPTPAQVREGMRDAIDRGFLWRIRSDGRTSYLYGTVHVARLEWTFPGPKVSAALAASDTIALELDPLAPEVQERLASAQVARRDVALPQPLKRRLARRAQAECLPAGAFAALDPEMQVASLSSLSARRQGLDPAYGIDAHLADWGRVADKRVVSLETPERQLEALRMGSRQDTVVAIANALDDLEHGRAGSALVRAAQVWADADFDALDRYESWCGCMKTPAERALMTRLLEERNPALADGIAALHAGGRRVFAAVGSLHMVGAGSLPALLARRGFEVERVRLRD